MRLMDLAAAAVIATVSISLIVSMSPVQFNTYSREYSEEGALRTLLLGIVVTEGIPWFAATPAKGICSGVAAFSNSSVTVSATVGGVSCGGLPPSGSVSASLVFPVGPAEVTLEAWEGAGQ
jgi:hypothetical protein